jgi:hypothetical protein
MVQTIRRVLAPLIAISAWMAAAAAIAQQGPVAVMFSADQKRDASLAPSFLRVDLPATRGAGLPGQVYLSAGDLERAFDEPEYRPDAAIVPTNTELVLTAPGPTTQRVLIDRVRKEPEAMLALEEQVATRRRQPAAGAGEMGPLRIGLDAFVAQLPRRGGSRQGNGAFPGTVCLVATDFPNGGAIDRRELFAQDRLRKGIADCLAALDAGGAGSLVLPLMGAASSGTQTTDALLEGQRALMECRLINATAGIALGIHDFAAGRANLREIGVVQWDQELARMFRVPSGSRAARSAQAAYRAYAEQVAQAFRRGLAGDKTTQSDVSGGCSAILDVSQQP